MIENFIYNVQHKFEISRRPRTVVNFKVIISFNLSIIRKLLFQLYFLTRCLRNIIVIITSILSLKSKIFEKRFIIDHYDLHF